MAKAKATTLTVVADEDDSVEIEAADEAEHETDEGEAEPDQELVNESAIFIRESIRKTVERGMAEIGEHLFKRFFDGDPAKVRSKKAGKAASFRALLERCETMELPLRRSALHNAVSVAAMQHQLGAGQTAYKQLPQSHQVALLPLRDPKKVEKFATKTLSKKLTVRVLKKEIAEERAASSEGQPRGRKPDPTLLKSMKGATAAFTVEGRLRAVTKGQIEELGEEQKGEVLKMAQQLLAHLEGVVGKLG